MKIGSLIFWKEKRTMKSNEKSFFRSHVKFIVKYKICLWYVHVRGVARWNCSHSIPMSDWFLKYVTEKKVKQRGVKVIRQVHQVKLINAQSYFAYVNIKITKHTNNLIYYYIEYIPKIAFFSFSSPHALEYNEYEHRGISFL